MVATTAQVAGSPKAVVGEIMSKFQFTVGGGAGFEGLITYGSVV
jgi:hypothetical protein